MKEMPWLSPLRTEFRDRLSSERMPHAILLAGPKGTGKLGLARDMVASLLCQQQSFPACGSCRSCQLLASGAHPDRQELTRRESEDRRRAPGNYRGTGAFPDYLDATHLVLQSPQGCAGLAG